MVSIIKYVIVTDENYKVTGTVSKSYIFLLMCVKFNSLIFLGRSPALNSLQMLQGVVIITERENKSCASDTVVLSRQKGRIWAYKITWRVCVRVFTSSHFNYWKSWSIFIELGKKFTLMETVNNTILAIDQLNVQILAL